jgi:putative ABC transport system permease protein
LAIWLLCRRLPDEWRDFVVGDLQEEFATRRRHSRLAAYAWFWWQTMRVLAAPPRSRRVQEGRAMTEPLGQFRRDAWAMRTYRMLERLREDLRFATRLLLRHPMFFVVTRTVLALGVGATTAMFSVVNTTLLSPLEFREPSRLVMLEEQWPPRFPRFEAAPPDFLTWKEACRSYTAVAAFRPLFFTLNEGAFPERVAGMRVSANLTDLVGVSPILGRAFRDEEDAPGQNHVALLGYSLWQRSFGGDAGVIGRVVHMNGLPFTVIGVMPPAFRFPAEAEIWTPMGLTPEERKDGGHVLWAVGRLKPGVTAEQARAELDVVMKQLYPTTWRGRVISFDDYFVGADVRRALVVLFAAAGCLLLIACVNVVNLLLARQASRERELALRTSLGATRGRLLQQLVTETVLLSALGGALGLIVALVAVTLVRTWPWPGIYRLDQTTLDFRALTFAMAASAITGLVCGLFPALRWSRSQNTSHAGTRGAGSVRRTHIRTTLVIAEVAIAVVLLVGAGVLLKSLGRLLDVPLGFNPRHVLAVGMNLPPRSYSEPFRQVQFADRLLDRLAGVDGVEAVGVSTSSPLTGVTDVGIRFDGRPANSPLASGNANYFRVTPGYVRAMQIPLVRGRLFAEQDSATSPPVVLINETLARRFFPDEDPIGKRLDITGNTYMREIVGVVGDVKTEGVRAPVAPQVYEPFAQKPAGSFRVLLRTSMDPLQLAETVRKHVREIDDGQPVSTVRSMEDIVAGSLAHDRFPVFVLGGFAGLALILAAVGLYGVVAYFVTERTKEIGVRMALGARPREIQRVVVVQSLRMVLIGLGLGLAGAAIVAGVLKSLLFEVQPIDPTTMVVVAAVLGAVALMAAIVPARRAARVDPVVALRAE